MSQSWESWHELDDVMDPELTKFDSVTVTVSDQPVEANVAVSNFCQRTMDEKQKRLCHVALDGVDLTVEEFEAIHHVDLGYN